MSKIDKYYSEAVDTYLAGNFPKALTSCQKALQKDKNDDRVLNLYALIQSQLGNQNSAISLLEKAVKINPKNIEAITNLANIYQNKKEFDKALILYKKAIDINPKFAKAYYNAAIAMRELGQSSEAKNLLRQAIEFDSSMVDSYINLSAIYKAEGDTDEAVSVLENSPQDVRVLASKALLLSEKKMHSEAIEVIGNALAINTTPELLNDFGIVLSNAKRYDDALSAYMQAVAMKNDFDIAYSNLADIFLFLGDEQKAKGALIKAITINPDSAANYVNFGVYLKKIGEIKSAEEAFLKALSIEPANFAACTNLGIINMYLGNYEPGLELYEKRKKPFIKTHKPLWSGEDLDGKILFIYHEQGFGDTINFARLLFDRRFEGKNIFFMPQKELYSLFKNSSIPCKTIDFEYITSGDFYFDYHLPLMSLLSIVGVKETAIPQNIQYINIEKTKKNHFDILLAGAKGKKIGVVWQGNKDYSGDKERSVELSFFTRLIDDGHTLVSLQKDINENEAELFAKESNMYDFSSELSSFSDTAALIDNLDLVITIDTSVAHLSGAIGVKTFILLPYVPDWRWGVNGEKTKWYDSVILFRQHTRNDWRSVFDDVYTSVKSL